MTRRKYYFKKTLESLKNKKSVPGIDGMEYIISLYLSEVFNYDGKPILNNALSSKEKEFTRTYGLCFLKVEHFGIR